MCIYDKKVMNPTQQNNVLPMAESLKSSLNGKTGSDKSICALLRKLVLYGKMMKTITSY